MGQEKNITNLKEFRHASRQQQETRDILKIWRVLEEQLLGPRPGHTQQPITVIGEHEIGKAKQFKEVLQHYNVKI